LHLLNHPVFVCALQRTNTCHTQRRNKHFEKQRWGRDHDLVVVLCKNAHLDADIGWELYQVFFLLACASDVYKYLPTTERLTAYVMCILNCSYQYCSKSRTYPKIQDGWRLCNAIATRVERLHYLSSYRVIESIGGRYCVCLCILVAWCPKQKRCSSRRAKVSSSRIVYKIYIHTNETFALTQSHTHNCGADGQRSA